MTAHELAQELLSGPDLVVVVKSDSYDIGFFSISDIKKVSLVPRSNSSLYYLYDPDWHKTEPIEGLELQ